ncbi:DUF255 domain-containing protein [Mangrovivirga sp. M17]|uniref:DUF255 domain-containing protein n=1 Tax=Mangrovivirga halotolerans TaxID=2993936 RepID=A0ABT3RR50_9BACT|nr:thioredoxin fold domain-containing protein [Mangrovivirga halotolerans]MCX2744257.1 DUF255 domain-containing protein [Mangrovivirga halotolerans]
MKLLFSLLALTLTLNINSLFAQDSDINWLTPEQLEAKVKEEPRKIFFDVYTDWCGWCKVMDKKTFSDPEVVEYVNENFYAVKLDAESQETFNFMGQQASGVGLARSFKVNSYPTIVFMDEKMTTIFPVPGFRKADEFMDVLKKLDEMNLGQNNQQQGSN